MYARVNFRTVRRHLLLGALAMGLVAVVGLRALAQETPEDGSGFVDIVENIHEEDIRYIVERGLTVGCDLTGPRYCPDQDVTRAEMATFLTRALRLDTKVPYLGVYADVAEGAWYTPFVEAMGAYGLTDTRISGSYRPDDYMLRSEMAIFLAKAFQLASTDDASVSSFRDIPADAGYSGAAEAILEAGITRGCGVDPLRYCPDDTVKRDTMAAFLARALRGADLRRVLDLAPGREILRAGTIGTHTWNVWVCENAPVGEDLVDYLNRDVTSYFRWLSGGNYRIRFRYGTDPSPEVTAVLDNCTKIEQLHSRPAGNNVFIGGDLWTLGHGVVGVGGGWFDTQNQRFSRNVWMDRRAVYNTVGYAHEIGHTFGWPHNHAGPGATEALRTKMDIMATDGQLIGTNAHNLFQSGWIEPEKVEIHSEGTAIYTLVTPHSEQGTELLVLPLGSNRLLSVGARVYRGFDEAIIKEGVELYEIRMCGWQPGCKEVFLPPGTASIHPVVLGVGDSWSERIPAISDGRHFQTDMRVSVTDREGRSYTVEVEQTHVAEDGFSVIDVGNPGVCGIRFSGSVSCWGWGGAEDVPEGDFTSVGLGYLVCGIRATDAGMECWGLSYDGMPPPSGEFSSVSVMGHHACGLRKNGTVACLGLYEDSKPAVRPPDGTFISVSAGLSHACGIRADRNVECWGRHNGAPTCQLQPGNLLPSVRERSMHAD